MNHLAKTGAPPTVVRFAILAVVLGLLVAVTEWAPPAVAAPRPGKRCDEVYNITKPTPPKNQLPGFGGEIPEGLTYDYDSPAEAARVLPALDQRQRDKYGANTDGKTIGTPEHVYAAYNRHEADARANGKTPLAWDRWLKSYVTIQDNRVRGAAFEKAMIETLGLGGPDWVCQASIPGYDDRIYDAVNKKEKIALEFKSGPEVTRNQVPRDGVIQKNTGYDLRYFNGQTPKPAAEKLLQQNGLTKPINMNSVANVTNRAPTVSGPTSELMTPDSKKLPSRGPSNEMVGGSGENREQARQLAEEEKRLGRISGAPDQTLRRPGGIDFSTMELRYVAEAPDGGLRYSFQANDNPNEEDEPSYGGLAAAQLTSDSLFTWLALPPPSFWVNLNPDQPDRIMDDKLASTDAGRVMLQSDLKLKRTTAKLMIPDNDTGRQLWESMRGRKCWPSYRSWIEPLPATVRDKDGQLYILDTPLTVKMERIDLKTQPVGVQRCDDSEENINYNLGQLIQIVAPKTAEAVNTAPEYEDLRRVYYSRVAAEWIRQRNAAKPNAFAPIVDSGDVRRWPARTPWSKQDVYNEYLKSYKNGDYHHTYVGQYNGLPWIWEITTGGVDFSKTPREPIPEPKFQANYPRLPNTVKASQQAPVGYENKAITWMGGGIGEQTPKPPPTTTQPPTSSQPPPSQPAPSQPAPSQSTPSQPAPSQPQGPPNQPKPPGLALTGASIGGLVALGLALLGGGTALMIWKRRRRTSLSGD